MSAESIIDLVPLVLFLAWVVVGVWLMVTNHRLVRYVRESHYDRWCYLSSSRVWFSGMPKPFRWLPYIFSDQGEEDPKVVELKTAVKRSLLYVVCVFGAALLMVLAVAVFVVFFQK